MKIVIRYSSFIIPLAGAMISFILFLYSLLGDLTIHKVEAQMMRNDSYILKWGNFNSFAGKASDASRTVTFTGGQNAIGLYSGTNYKVRAGFQYIYSIIPFSFSISNTVINFGSLVPGEPLTRTTNLTVSNGSAYGYQVTAQENNALRVLSTGIDIQDTTCDAGTCTETTAAAWTSPLTYGFGYRCDNLSGTDCSTDFATTTFYKQFADIERSETPQTLMSSTSVGTGRQSQITYKLNISATQQAGLYQNVITYIATPSI